MAIAGLLGLLVAPTSAQAAPPRGGAEQPPAGPHVRIKGNARIDAHAGRAAGKLVLSGTVVDDTTHPVADGRVTVSLARTASPAEAVTLPATSPESCSDGAPGPLLEKGVLLLATDDAARFCTRLALPIDRYVVHLESLPTRLVDDARLDLVVDLALEPVTLRFDPERSVLSLDEGQTGLEVVASTEDDSVTSAAVGIPLLLTNETGTPLGSAVTNASGRARFGVEAARLGPAGRGELRVSFAGSRDAGASTHGMPIERRTLVTLFSTDAVDGTLPAGSPEDGVVVGVHVDPRCAARGCTGSPTGTVEARLGDTIVGAAPLDRGAARLMLTFAMPAANDVALRLRYVPDAPWYQPGGELALTLPMRATSPWREIPLALAGLAVIGWLVFARVPPGSRAAHRSASDGPAARHDAAEAGVDLVRAGPSAHGWTGRIRDAHDGFAVGEARIVLERPGFQSVEVLAQGMSDPDGAFVLAPIEVRPGDVLLAEGPLHSALRRPVPAPGELDIALVLRRRVLVDRLVAWARRRGKPFDARPEPTPDHVRRAAAGDRSLAQWADAVERAAYGGGVVNEQAQREVDGLAPSDPTDPALSSNTGRPPVP
jgi:hypothetical protein